MNAEESRLVGEKGPTIDSIEVAEFETHSALKEWLGKHGPEFVHAGLSATPPPERHHSPCPDKQIARMGFLHSDSQRHWLARQWRTPVAISGFSISIT